MLDINLEKQLPVITMNFEEVKASLIEGSKKYKGLIVTAEGLKDCKTMQGELSTTRIKLDNYRKDVKKEMTKPITEFEDKCKELIALVVEVETPLKAGIEVFNQKVRDEKKEIASGIIQSFIREQGLIEKYSKELTVIDKYMNITSKDSDVVNDVATRGYLLLQEQEQEIETLQIMKDAIENINKGIDAKFDIKDFQSLIDMNYSAVKIMAEINSRGERIKLQEEKAIADKAAKAEKEVQERIVKAEREAVLKAQQEERRLSLERELAEKEAERIRIANLPKTGQIVQKAEEVAQIVDVDFKEEVAEKVEVYFLEIRVEAVAEKIAELGVFLRANNYSYTKLVPPTLLEVK